MNDDTAAILVDLLEAGPADAPSRYRDIHQWRYDQALTRAKSFIATGVSIATALVLAQLKDELDTS